MYLSYPYMPELPFIIIFFFCFDRFRLHIKYEKIILQSPIGSSLIASTWRIVVLHNKCTCTKYHMYNTIPEEISEEIGFATSAGRTCTVGQVNWGGGGGRGFGEQFSKAKSKSVSEKTGQISPNFLQSDLVVHVSCLYNSFSLLYWYVWRYVLWRPSYTRIRFKLVFSTWNCVIVQRLCCVSQESPHISVM